MSTQSKRVKECAEWLAECLRLGWPKESLDALEAIWWKYHPDPDTQDTNTSASDGTTAPD